MQNNIIESYIDVEVNGVEPILLFEKDAHKIYWVGIDDNVAFRCNTYLIQDGDECILFDPGNQRFFVKVQEMISKITDPINVKYIVVSHQDPDIAASLPLWLQFNPDITLISSGRTNVLLPHYGIDGYKFHEIASNNILTLKSGNQLKFIESPFLHFPGAFTTLDLTSHFLFSSDIWAALDVNWKLVVDDFDEHENYLDLFHIDYMASNIAARGYVQKIKDETINAILPQHGSIIGKHNVQNALEYLENLRCGTDIIYSDLN